MVAETSNTRAALAPRHGNHSRTTQPRPMVVVSSANSDNGLTTVRGTTKPTGVESGKDGPPRPNRHSSVEAAKKKNNNSNLHPADASNTSASGSKHGNSMTRPPTHITSSSSRLPPQQRLTITPAETMKAVRRPSDPAADQEQSLFDQRLCEDPFGVAVRKINQHGKASLRYVKCVDLSDNTGNRSVSSKSASSRGGRWNSRSSSNRSVPSTAGTGEKSNRALVWGKKNQVPLDRFVAVRKGKNTDRARRNTSPSNRIVSILTDDIHLHLDIEAPTQLDRDKFARAFARFLQVPLDGSEDALSVQSAEVRSSLQKSTASLGSGTDRWSAPGDVVERRRSNNHVVSPLTDQQLAWPPPLPPSSDHQRSSMRGSSHHSSHPSSSEQQSNSGRGEATGAIVSLVPGVSTETNQDDEGSDVSSITGNGYDQELVEELHHALNDLRAELDDSRAEAARAVKVAEQAIQSAEKSSSKEWQNTVTHKAAEAAAQAQKRSAEAMAKQRIAEERLEGERRTAAFWKKQAEIAEEEAGKLQTRAAAAEVQRSAVEERLESERHLISSQMSSVNARVAASDARQRDTLEAALERNRALEYELDATRKELENRLTGQGHAETDGTGKTNSRRKMSFGRKKKPADTKSLLAQGNSSTSSIASALQSTEGQDQVVVSADQVQKLYAEMAHMRHQFEILRRATADELVQLPVESRLWADQVANIVTASQSEVLRLRSRLACETASRRKLLNEVQDLRGCVRVYCRPRPSLRNGAVDVFSLPSQNTLVLHRERFVSDETAAPMSFEFDRVFGVESAQEDVYGEVEEVCLGALDGYSVCVLAYGQSGCGKTRTVLGDINVTEDDVEFVEHGIQLRAMQQLFSISEHRSDRYDDQFTLTIVEVNDERLCDLLAGTDVGDSRGEVVMAENKSRRKTPRNGDGDETLSLKQTKLEIRTDLRGDTVVQGALSVTVESFQELTDIWTDCLAVRAQRLFEQGIEIHPYESSSHVIATIHVVSSNIATGIGSAGKLQFVDLAGSDLIPRKGSTQPKLPEDSLVPTGTIALDKDWQFANRSLETLNEVIEARAQYARNVPYRNSTLTHLLRDSLEADTKVVLVACLSSEEDDLRESTATLRFASHMRRVNIGKATKHTLSPP